MSSIFAQIPTNGLIAWYPFNGNAIDESGTGNDGVVYGATPTYDRYGNANSAYYFNGVNSYIEVANSTSLNPANAMTLCAWYKPEYFVAGDGNAGIVDKGYTSWSSPFYQYKLGTSGQYGSLSNGTAFSTSFTINNILTQIITPADIYMINNWYFFVSIYDGNTLKLYVNNVLIQSVTATGPINSYNTPLYIGKTSIDNLGFILGTIDDVRIYNRALKRDEITILYTGCDISVTTQPINQSVTIGNNAMFSVASSDTNSTYHWQTDIGMGFVYLSNAGQYYGAMNDTLSISNTSLTNNNQLFRCIITSGNCIDTSNVATLTVNNVGINEVIGQNQLKIYPNPAKDKLTIETNSILEQRFEIINPIGQTVYISNLNKKATINTSAFANGVYILKLYSDKETLIRKLVIQ